MKTKRIKQRNGKGQFVKGIKYQLGYKHTDETKEKIRKARARQGSNVWNKGTNSSGMKGKKHKLYSRIKSSLSQSGEKNHNWKGGITPLRTRIWHSFKFRQWRSDIFERDNYTCQECGTRGGDLESHHIESFAYIINKYNIKSLEEALKCEELWNINNGLTLCHSCHLKTENYGGRKKE